MGKRQDPRTLTEKPRDARSGHARLVPRRDTPASPPAPVTDPRKASGRQAGDPRVLRAGRRAALVLVGVGLYWISATWAGQAFGWSVRLRALLDLFALAGFGFALYLTYQVWRLRRTHRG